MNALCFAPALCLALFVLPSCSSNAAPSGEAQAQAQAKVVQAKSAEDLFAQYQQLEKNFDPAVATLYADDAKISTKRIYPDGQVKERTLPTDMYKMLIVEAMPVAKSRGDYSSYSDVQFQPEGSRVRIRATRYSHLKDYSGAFYLVCEERGGRWVIVEEHSETRP